MPNDLQDFSRNWEGFAERLDAITHDYRCDKASADLVASRAAEEAWGQWQDRARARNISRTDPDVFFLRDIEYIRDRRKQMARAAKVRFRARLRGLRGEWCRDRGPAPKS